MENDPRSEHIYAHPYFLRGIDHERKRIIALLEEICIDDPECVVKPCGCYEAEILLIKGENE